MKDSVRVTDPISLFFWTPYILFVMLSAVLIRFFTKVAIGNIRNREFGYKLKICFKATYGLILLNREVYEMEGVRFDQPHDFICKCDQELPKEQQTVFKVKFLDAKQQAKLRDMMYNVSGVGNARSERFLTGSAALKALEYGLLGWENFNFPDGVPIPFSTENFSTIPPAQRDEIANYIRGIEEGEG